jgi:hypothetical protein
MRYILVVLLVLLAVGCGTPGHMSGDPLRVATFSPPSIMALTPDNVPVNSVPFTMTINGSNFGSDAIAFWHGMPQSTLMVTSSQLMVAITDSDLLFTGPVPVYVRTGGANSNTVNFNVTP